MLRFIRNIFQLIISPEHGWEDIDAELESGAIDASDMYRRVFLPMIAVCSLAAFARLLYPNGPGFLGALQNSIIVFGSLFLAYHIGVYVFSATMDRLRLPEMVASPERERLMVMFCVAVIGVIALLGSVIKVSLALIQFLPVYVVFIIWKGARFLQVDEAQIGFYMLMATFSIVGSAYVLGFLFEALI